MLASSLQAYEVQKGEGWYAIARSLGTMDVGPDAAYLAAANGGTLQSPTYENQIVWYNPARMSLQATDV